MQRDFTAYLCDIYNSADSIISYTLGFDRDMFGAVQVVQDAVRLRFEIIGEAVVQSRHHHPVEVLQLGDVQGIVNFRNYLVHRYHSVSIDIVWDVIQNDLPSLFERVKELLGENPCS